MLAAAAAAAAFQKGFLPLIRSTAAVLPGKLLNADAVLLVHTNRMGENDKRRRDVLGCSFLQLSSYTWYILRMHICVITASTPGGWQLSAYVVS